MKNLIKEMLTDQRGQISTMRVVWSIAVLTIIFTWSYVSIRAGVMQSFTTGDALWMATLFGGKVAQSHIEHKSLSNSESVEESSQKE